MTDLIKIIPTEKYTFKQLADYLLELDAAEEQSKFDFALTRGRILLVGRRLADDAAACAAENITGDNPDHRYGNWLAEVGNKLLYTFDAMHRARLINLAKAADAYPVLEDLVRDKQIPMSALYSMDTTDEPRIRAVINAAKIERLSGEKVAALLNPPAPPKEAPKAPPAPKGVAPLKLDTAAVNSPPPISAKIFLDRPETPEDYNPTEEEIAAKLPKKYPQAVPEKAPPPPPAPEPMPDTNILNGPVIGIDFDPRRTYTEAEFVAAVNQTSGEYAAAQYQAGLFDGTMASMRKKNPFDRKQLVRIHALLTAANDPKDSELLTVLNDLLKKESDEKKRRDAAKAKTEERSARAKAAWEKRKAGTP